MNWPNKNHYAQNGPLPICIPSHTLVQTVDCMSACPGWGTLAESSESEERESFRENLKDSVDSGHDQNPIY